GAQAFWRGTGQGEPTVRFGHTPNFTAPNFAFTPSSGKIVGCWQFSFRFTDSGLEAFLVEGNCRHWVLLRYFDSGCYLCQQFLLRRRSHFFAGTSSPPLSHAYGRAH